MSTKKIGHQRPFQNSFSRPAHYTYVGKDKNDRIVMLSASQHDFYPKEKLKSLRDLGVPLPEGR